MVMITLFALLLVQPSPIQSKGSTCSCPVVEVTSSGIAAEAQSQYLGKYRIGDQFNSMSTWDQDGGDASLFIGCNDEFCCQDCWSIGILNLNLPVKLIQSSSSEYSCPYSPGLSWTVWNGGSWQEDNTLQVFCSGEAETTTETTNTGSTLGTSTTSDAGPTNTQPSPGECSEPWVSAYDVGLGCLLMGGDEMEGLSQPSAKAACQERGARLVEVYNSGQFELLKLLAIEAETELMEQLEFAPWWWIGLTDQGSDGSWYWGGSGAAANFTNWDIGEPSQGETYNCAQMESVLELEGGWLSLRCEEETPAIFPICQKY